MLKKLLMMDAHLSRCTNELEKQGRATKAQVERLRKVDLLRVVLDELGVPKDGSGPENCPFDRSWAYQRWLDIAVERRASAAQVKEFLKWVSAKGRSLKKLGS